MNGELSQLVALSSAANGVISGSLSPFDFTLSHSEFRYCKTARFVDFKRNLFRGFREVVRHENPHSWLASLKPNNTRQAWLTFTPTQSPELPDHIAAGFAGGGGQWELVVAGQDFTECWLAGWAPNHRTDPNNKVWDVTYGCVERNHSVKKCPDVDLMSSISSLDIALDSVMVFAYENCSSNWGDLFKAALDQLKPIKAVSFPEHVDFVSQNSYPVEAQRLFATIYKAWVFAGMGSWNDMVFEEHSVRDRYNKLTSTLYLEMTDALQRATWSFNQTGIA